MKKVRGLGVILIAVGIFCVLGTVYISSMGVAKDAQKILLAFVGAISLMIVFAGVALCRTSSEVESLRQEVRRKSRFESESEE